MMFHKCLFRDLLKGEVPQDGPLLEDAEIKGYVEQYAADQVSVYLFLVFAMCALPRNWAQRLKQFACWNLAKHMMLCREGILKITLLRMKL